MSRARMFVLALLGAFLLSASSAMAQESSFLGRNEVSLQGTGFFTKDSQGNGINQHSTNTGGILINYRYQLYRCLCAEPSYRHAPKTPEDITFPGCFFCQAERYPTTGGL